MEQDTAQEGLGVEGGQPGGVAVSAVFPAEGHLALVESDQPIVGDRDAASLAKIDGFTDLDGSQPDAWRYVTEIQDAGKPADVTGYR